MAATGDFGGGQSNGKVKGLYVTDDGVVDIPDVPLTEVGEMLENINNQVCRLEAVVKKLDVLVNHYKPVRGSCEGARELCEHALGLKALSDRIQVVNDFLELVEL